MFRRSTGSLLRVTKVLREQENWREHGISYVKYLNICTDAVHKCVKESKQAKYTKFSVAAYHAQKPDGSGGIEKIEKVAAQIKDY